jgi:hypothetical protein
MQVVANSAHHDLTGVEAHPHPQIQAVGAAHLLGIGAHGGLHCQGGIASAQGMVFMGDGGAKQGHDAVAQHLIHRPLEAVHGVHHMAEGRVQQSLGGFRVYAADELRRVLEIGEEDRHLLAFAFESTFQRQDFIGKVARSVGVRGTRGRVRGAVAGS